jgi:hypothetical protein
MLEGLHAGARGESPDLQAHVLQGQSGQGLPEDVQRGNEGRGGYLQDGPERDAAELRRFHHHDHYDGERVHHHHRVELRRSRPAL